MATLNTYLNFNGNTEQAFDFYKAVFGGEFLVLQRYGDIDGAEGMNEDEKNKIMHVSLPIANTVLMGTDMPASMPKILFGTNISLSIGTESEEEAELIFNGLAVGGKITMPLEKTFWGAFFGMVTDQFGIRWMVNYDYPA